MYPDRDVIDIIKERSHLSFQDAAGAFYHSKTYQSLQNTENTLWAESAGYIADRYYEELEEAQTINNQIKIDCQRIMKDYHSL